MKDLELWGGHEPTVNRVRDKFLDQTRMSGHQDRLGDLTLFAETGFKALRYPVLWERVSPKGPDQFDWSWSDERLNEIRRLGMKPIVGLTHHGSGPKYTHLLDDGFAPGLAEHARATAERYPWVQDWTPVNEPLTTARFSALYGVWYPHARDEGAWWTALLNQIDAVRLAMREIRKVNPEARLVQTEDLGHTFATPPLGYQAEFENLRRWLTWDLLTGKVTREHPMWSRIEDHALMERAGAIADDPCPPDVLGVNHYLTSERFLDHRLERYPTRTHGGNFFTRYADVEAVRALASGPIGLEGILEMAWERYGITLAVTESHNGCTRDEQMRWTHEAWQAAQRLRGRGVRVEAVTVWALLGSHDWNSLLTVEAGHYEPGAWDLRGGEPRPTAMVPMLRALARGEEPDHPALASPGWWRRDVRLEYKPSDWLHEAAPTRRAWGAGHKACAPLLITGATGTLGQAFARACELRALPYVLTDHKACAIEDRGAVSAALEAHQPWAVINTAGWVRVDDAEEEAEACLRANAEGAAILAEVCAARELPFVGFSSDLVFDGRANLPYLESDALSPLNEYGRSKAEAERRVLDAGGRALMIRTAAFFSPHDEHNFAAWVARELAGGNVVRAARDCVVSPTYVPDLVNAALDLLIDGETGIWHLANPGALSWAEFARRVAAAMGLDERLVLPVPGADLGWKAARPAYAALGSERGVLLPSFDSALARFAAHARRYQPEAPAPAEVRPAPRRTRRAPTCALKGDVREAERPALHLPAE